MACFRFHRENLAGLVLDRALCSAEEQTGAPLRVGAQLGVGDTTSGLSVLTAGHWARSQGTKTNQRWPQPCAQR